ncbi:MAG: MoaD/ThiS family protein [Candidatus Thorarchaeota archaeon]
MKVKFKSFGPLRRVLKGEVIEIDVPEESTVRQVIDSMLEMYGKDAKRLVLDGDRISGNLILMLNQKDVDTIAGEQTVVKEDDEVVILPHVQGG